MFKKKFTKVATLSLLTLSIGGSALVVNTQSVDAKTVVSQTARKSVITFNVADLEEATNASLSSYNVQEMYNSLTKADSWKALGYNDSEAANIAQRVTLSSRQTQGILRNMVRNTNVEFKVVYISSGWFDRVNIGSEVVKVDTPNIEAPETGYPEIDLPVTGGLDRNIKEIEIEIDYRTKNKDIELDVEVKNNGRVKAEFENEATRTKLKGNQAEAVAVDIFNGVDVRTMSRTQIKNHVVTKLNADQNMKEFEFKVKYFDGSRVEFEIK